MIFRCIFIHAAVDEHYIEALTFGTYESSVRDALDQSRDVEALLLMQLVLLSDRALWARLYSSCLHYSMNDFCDGTLKIDHIAVAGGG